MTISYKSFFAPVEPTRTLIETRIVAFRSAIDFHNSGEHILPADALALVVDMLEESTNELANFGTV